MPARTYSGKMPASTVSTTAFSYRLRLLQRAELAMASEEPQAKKQKLSEEEEKTKAPAKLR